LEDLKKEKIRYKITVKEIADVAGYNRSTFYAYFTSVSDILWTMVTKGVLFEYKKLI